MRLGLIIKEPEVSKEAKDKIKERMIGIRERALKGESFEILATTYSQGPSAGNGGIWVLPPEAPWILLMKRAH